jgi:hypothetical protein
MNVKFDHIKDLKRQPVQTGFPVPVSKQMQQLTKPLRKLRFPKPDKVKSK